MTYEEVKEFFNRGYRIKERIAAKQRRIEDWTRLAESTAIELKPVTAFSSFPTKKVEEAACNIIDLQNEIHLEIEELAGIELEIGKAIKESPLENTDRFIMELRYLNYMKWEEIAVSLNYAYRWIMRRHKRALMVLAENWPC